MAEQADKEILKLLGRTKEIVCVTDIRSLASVLREFSNLVIDNLREKVNGVVDHLQESVTVDSSGEMKRKFAAVASNSDTGQQDAKVMRIEGTPESGSEPPADGWPCASCTFVNHPSLETCEMCDHPRCTIAMLQMQLEDLKHKTSLVEQPSKWQPVDPGTRQRLVELAENDEDYVDISKKMLAFGFYTSLSVLNDIKEKFGSKTPLYHITKIERNENLHLYQMYSIKKDQMKEENGPLVENESMLWHGTSSDCVGSISSYGFNRSHSGKHRTSYGKGVYFSTGPGYASKSKFAARDHTGLKHMFYSRVLTGRHTIGNSTMEEPPMYMNKLGRFNSLVNHMQKPSIFVVFHDAQSYPEFLITFTGPL